MVDTTLQKLLRTGFLRLSVWHATHAKHLSEKQTYNFSDSHPTATTESFRSGTLTDSDLKGNLIS